LEARLPDRKWPGHPADPGRVGAAIIPILEAVRWMC